ncbi:hypothetical protein E3E31_00010 [Thermococcus sp. M39]|uniref:hypothetical protein n=1 Tax=Thermococcus sp. M39 TaxID=1638262 RepID=UPI00143A2B12|nr:hypothetical protein [Thermococcus sp. M39]NJE06941.1 hypothetical protein [Thermococcus sp. M39]
MEACVAPSTPVRITPRETLGAAATLRLMQELCDSEKVLSKVVDVVLKGESEDVKSEAKRRLGVLTRDLCPYLHVLVYATIEEILERLAQILKEMGEEEALKRLENLKNEFKNASFPPLSFRVEELTGIAADLWATASAGFIEVTNLIYPSAFKAWENREKLLTVLERFE